MKKYHENIWYGTLRECIDELWTLIDFKHLEMPRVDFAAYVPEQKETAFEAYKIAEGWFGFKNCNEFDGDTISLFFGHYGGGGIESLELKGEDINWEKSMLMYKITQVTSCCGYLLKPDEYTVFELE